MTGFDMCDGHLQHSLRFSKQPFSPGHACRSLWALAVLGQLDMRFLEHIVSNLGYETLEVCCGHSVSAQ